MRTDIWFELLPVETMHAVQANHINLIDQFAVVLISLDATQNVHLGAGGEQDCTTQVILVERILEI